MKENIKKFDAFQTWAFKTSINSHAFQWDGTYD